MAHFARIDSENKVQEVIVVSNDVLLDENDEEQEALGQQFIASLGLGGTWLQCSYNGNFRGSYPGNGFTYDKARDAFIPVKPYESWVLNEETYLWEAPIPYPGDETKFFVWDEETGAWVEA